MDYLVHDLLPDPQSGHQESLEYRGSLMRITVSGLPGSGTTSISRYLQEHHKFELISAGEVFRQLAIEHNLDLAEFGRLAEQDESYDKMIDARQKEIASRRDNIIIEGRLSGWMVDNADLRIWLFAPIGCRITRIISRDQVPDEQAATEITTERERCEAGRYRSYYNIDISDLSIYHMVLNSEHWGIAELGAIVDAGIEGLKEKPERDPHIPTSHLSGNG
jgi:cytidylate kinase